MFGNHTFLAKYNPEALATITIGSSEISIGNISDIVNIACPYKNHGVVALCGADITNYTIALITINANGKLQASQVALNDILYDHSGIALQAEATVHPSGKFIVANFYEHNLLKVFRVDDEQTLTEVTFPIDRPFFTGRYKLDARKITFDNQGNLWLAGGYYGGKKGEISCNSFYVGTDFPTITRVASCVVPKGYVCAMAPLTKNAGIIVATDVYSYSAKPCTLMEFNAPTPSRLAKKSN